MKKKKTPRKKSGLLTRATMNVPLESARHPQAPVLAKSPTAQDIPAIQQIADYMMAIDVQQELTMTAHEEALTQYKEERRLLHQYHSTYDDNFPSLAVGLLSP